MNTSKCQILLRAVELGNLTRTAEELGYTQSAVSRTIASLEREWGVPLLVRGREGALLTSQGEALLPQIRALCAAEERLEEQVAALHGLTQGKLRVGAFNSVSIHWLPGIMKRFLTRYPGIRFELVCKWEFAEVEDLVRRGEVDCGFLGLPAGPGLDTIPLFQDQFLVALPPDHPLAGAPCYPAARFQEDPYIAIPEDRDWEIKSIFQEDGLHPNLQYTVNDDLAILAMVEQGLGVSIRAELVLRDSGRRFAAIPLEKPRFRQIGLALPKGAEGSPLTQRFVECVREWLGVE
ncbi:MAG: LysR family transcriptional regulator [Flavonifractor sp.]|nr:LysR family transcriptional regulator [Flavonifractor sp.]